MRVLQVPLIHTHAEVLRTENPDLKKYFVYAYEERSGRGRVEGRGSEVSEDSSSRSPDKMISEGSSEAHGFTFDRVFQQLYHVLADATDFIRSESNHSLATRTEQGSTSSPTNLDRSAVTVGGGDANANDNPAAAAAADDDDDYDYDYGDDEKPMVVVIMI